jgi:hypothetical protein
MSAVSVLVIDCTRIGSSPPTPMPPIVRVPGRQQPVADQEIDDDEVAVELEVVGLVDDAHHLERGQQLEGLDLVVVATGLDILGQLEVVAVDGVGFEAALGVPAVGDDADRSGAVGDVRRQRGLLPALLAQVVLQRDAPGQAAGHHVVEFAGRDPTIGGAPADPEVRAVGPLHIAVQVLAGGADAEVGCHGAIHQEAGLAGVAEHWIAFAVSVADAVGAVQRLGDSAEGVGALVEAVRGAVPVQCFVR